MPLQSRLARDSLGEVAVPRTALYGAQTQRAVENFQISGLRMPPRLIRVLALIKQYAARTNAELGVLDAPRARAIELAAARVASGTHARQFPVDVFQTGSGTSTNMNMNEVIATMASRSLGLAVHPNDHVNLSQSSNDVMPASLRISAAMACRDQLLPALGRMDASLLKRAQSLDEVVKTGRTHLMDALPLTFGQELRTWAALLDRNTVRIGAMRGELSALPLGGTAIGTGVNAPAQFGAQIAAHLALACDLPLRPLDCAAEGIASQDTSLRLSGELRTLAVTMAKIAGDLRWMNSGPLAGLGEIALPAMQPGSSIMPGKVNPVGAEACEMACMQVIGLDAAIAAGAQRSPFQLNTMIPLIAFDLLHAIELLTHSLDLLRTSTVEPMELRQERIGEQVSRNPLLVTALAPTIGYDRAAAIAKQAIVQDRSIADVVREMTDLSDLEIDKLLDPLSLTRGGVRGGADSDR